MTIRRYLDEDVDVALAAALRQRGIDVLTTQEAGQLGLADEDQLTFATRGRACSSGRSVPLWRTSLV